MTPIDWDALPSHAGNELAWARGRLPTCTYAHRSFILQLGASRDVGHPARYVVKVFNEPDTDTGDQYEWESHVVSESPAGRVQISCRSPGRRVRSAT